MDEIVGQWWFEGEDERHPGNLKVDKDRIELQLNHGVVDEHITEWVRRGRGNILGRASDGGPISLLGCSESSTRCVGIGVTDEKDGVPLIANHPKRQVVRGGILAHHPGGYDEDAPTGE